jgi:hypothetical protein
MGKAQKNRNDVSSLSLSLEINYCFFSVHPSQPQIHSSPSIIITVITIVILGQENVLFGLELGLSCSAMMISSFIHRHGHNYFFMTNIP